MKTSLTSKKRESARCRMLTEHPNIRRKKHPQTHHHQNTTKNKERTLKAAKEKRQVTYIAEHITITAEFSTHTLNVRSWKDIIQT
jgi:hypothetical protein